MTIPDPNFVPLEIVGEVMATLSAFVGALLSVHLALNAIKMLVSWGLNAIGGR